MKWTYKHDNHGNGGYAEWWDLLLNGNKVGEVYKSEFLASEICTKLNWYERVDKPNLYGLDIDVTQED
jgi:hypothetical protein